AQFAALTSSQLGALDTSDLHALSTAHFAALSSTQVVGLTTSQIASLDTQDIAALSTSVIGGLTTDQVSHLTTDQIVALTTDQVMALETADIAAMTMSQVSAFESEDLAVMSISQMQALQGVSPIVLDLDGNGVRTLAASHGVQFDLTGTGHAQHVGWVGHGDGLLVLDRNGDGIINDGRELFGAATLLANGHRAGNGYVAMAQEDTNHDGKLSAADVNWDRLRLWVDANGNGKVDEGELQTLAQHGVASIDLKAQASTQVDNGNLLGLVSGWTGEDGKQHDVADVWFAQQSDRKLPSAGELLAPPPQALLPEHPQGDTSSGSTGVPPAAAVPAGTATHDAVAVHRNTLDPEQPHLPLI
ncbi:MAG TPA: heme utilization protein, partial [Burkholderiaceae bacterium]|nr:heme utilization protein [Burkholderiaceae bacterium]